MKVRELIRFSRQLLKCRFARTMMICLLPLGTEMFFRCAEAAVYCILLYFGEYDPIGLFSGRSRVQLSVAAVYLHLIEEMPMVIEYGILVFYLLVLMLT